jgi:3D (Asp-Asp-Asp) domain-containing protein
VIKYSVVREGISGISSEAYASENIHLNNADNGAVDTVDEGDETQDLGHSSPDSSVGEFTMYSKGDGYTPGTRMANGEEVHVGSVACPESLKFGTKIKVLGKVYTCTDRMAIRFRTGLYFDLYSDSIEDAKQFGRKKLTFQVL